MIYLGMRKLIRCHDNNACSRFEEQIDSRKLRKP